MRLSPNQRKIVDYLADGEWRCFATPDFFMKDDRKRISELNDAMGFVIEGMKCDGRCGIKHKSNVLMRRLVERAKREMWMYEEKVLTDGQVVRVPHLTFQPL